MLSVCILGLQGLEDWWYFANQILWVFFFPHNNSSILLLNIGLVYRPIFILATFDLTFLLFQVSKL